MSEARPWFTQAVQKAVNGMTGDHRLARIQELTDGVTADMGDFTSELSTLYVKTADFEKLLAQTVRNVADERNEDKRLLYRAFLADLIMSPCEPSERQNKMLRTLEELRTDHITVLRALDILPDLNAHHIGTPLQTLQKRLPNISRDRLEGLITQLNELGVTTLGEIKRTMTHHAAERLGDSLTLLGQNLMSLLKKLP